MNKTLTTIPALALALIWPTSFDSSAQEVDKPSDNQAEPQSQYAPYSFLIGQWEVRSEGSDSAIGIARIKWGPNRSYIWYSQSLLSDGSEEPHLEGILIWNGVHKNLDMLFSMDLKSGRVQEQGTLSVGPDGALMRDITAIYSAGVRAIGISNVGLGGATGRFRQTYKQIDHNKILTNAMRQDGEKWVPTFPGSDHLVMIRRTDH